MEMCLSALPFQCQFPLYEAIGETGLNTLHSLFSTKWEDEKVTVTWPTYSSIYQLE